jgi:hypothetical protein
LGLTPAFTPLPTDSNFDSNAAAGQLRPMIIELFRETRTVASIRTRLWLEHEQAAFGLNQAGLV